MDKKELEIYCDGSSRGNPGEGGFGLVVYDPDSRAILYDLYDLENNTTNNRQELKGLLSALQYALEHKDYNFTIYCDSAYCVNMCNSWIYNWALNNWTNSNKQEIKNKDLIQKIYNLLIIPSFDNYRIKKVKGHSGITGNNLADALATNNKEKYKEIINKNKIKYNY